MYDDAGRLVSTFVEREPEWTPDQVAMVAAVDDFDRLLGAHGQPMDEATSKDADPMNRAGTHYYKAGALTVTPEGAFVYAPLVDQAMKAQLDAEDKFRKAAGEGANLNGLFWPVQREERKRRGA